MLRITDVILKTDHSADEIGTAALKRLRIPKKRLLSTRIIKRSYDARNKENILFVYTLDVEIENEKEILDKIKTYKKISIAPVTEYKFKTKANSQNFKRPVVIGSGPCGLFCALILAQAGFRPIIIERGKSVKERSADTFGFWRDGHFDPASNVQFGEGGAGTFSDGKLNTQIRDPENYRIKVLEELASAGAPDEIRFVSKPHIGTFRLVK
ncbi:MAG: FAD-dependent monooxygenase, partial [Candidatus Delongbacteria bacterium]|nr:FAD-dependent monooxygenase [Candidatus Delongbacteria bacterium]